MYKVTEEDRKVFLEYLSRRPYIEVAALIARIASWKKLLKSVLLKYPKFSGWCTYINKKGNVQTKVLNNGKIVH